MLQEKINYSIELLRKHEQTALKLNPLGYYVAFSGGKDSQTIKKLCEMAGVKHTTHFNPTTVDPKEVLQYIHTYYPDVIWHRPAKSMFKLIEEHKSLPLRNMRYCCRLIKEVGGINNVVIIGVRKAESAKRAKRKEVEHMCIGGADKILIKPIFNWSTKEVWEFINTYIGHHCSLYDIRYYRIGCVLCPMAGLKGHLMDLKNFPRFEYAYKKAIKKNMAKGSYKQFKDADEVFDWWIRGISIKKYFAIKNHNNLGLV